MGLTRGPVVGHRVRATAPVRVADVGGWTDTWFGSPGQVCHLAVGPGVEVDAAIVDRSSLDPPVRLRAPALGAPVRLRAPSLGIDQAVGPDVELGWRQPVPGTHPLLEHAIAAVVGEALVDPTVGIEVTIRSAVPPGASLGTSAAVVVAVLGALDALIAAGRRSAADLAVLAHEVETERAGREAGVQDQWAAAMGGAGLAAIGTYPTVRHRSLTVPADALVEVGERLVTVVFGAHDSSQVHAEVINAIVGCSGVEHGRARAALRRLGSLATDAAAALEDGDVDGWASVLVAGTEAQRDLHARLVGPAHQQAIGLARSLGAAGWKVNGAGGDGGSLTVVAGTGGAAGSSAATATELAGALGAVDPTWSVVDLRPAPGLHVDLLA